ncbi:hypothetical protein HMPREF3038_02522 [Akkermansia sp. KLE1797]|nr:hypothetical protein HMPREF3038_02522 [Akkermansia sp. KLE1797]
MKSRSFPFPGKGKMSQDIFCVFCFLYSTLMVIVTVMQNIFSFFLRKTIIY